MFLNCSLTFALTVIDLVNINIINICFLSVVMFAMVQWDIIRVKVFVCVCVFVCKRGSYVHFLFLQTHTSLSHILNC